MDLRTLQFSQQELDDIHWKSLYYEPGEPLYSGSPWCGLEPGQARFVVSLSMADDPDREELAAWRKVIPEMIAEYQSLEQQLLAGATYAKEEREYLESALAQINEVAARDKH